MAEPFPLDDYESLPEDSQMWQHMLSGACAGTMEHSVMYPIDCVKTRLQCLRPTAPKYSGLFDGLYQLWHREGLRGSMRGIGAVICGAGPAHALYFASYEKTKTLFVNSDASHATNQLGFALSGALATVLHDFIMTPADAVKQRVQLYNSPYRNSYQCVYSVCRSQGISPLYRAYYTQLIMNIPMQSCHFMVYEFCQHTLNREHEYRPLTHVISGGLAGGIAAFITTPLDVCKTVLNTQEECSAAVVKESVRDAVVQPLTGQQPVKGLRQAMTLVWATYGFQGLFRGWQARVLFQMPGTAISWSVYEYFKWSLKKKQQKHYDEGPRAMVLQANSNFSHR